MKRFEMSSIPSVSVFIIILIVAGCAGKHRPTLDAGANFNREAAHVKEGRFDRAIPDYTKTKEINPKGTNQYVKRGVAYFKKGQYDQAISDFTKAIELSPEDVVAYINRGVAHFKKGQYDLAIYDLTKFIEINPKYSCIL